MFIYINIIKNLPVKTLVNILASIIINNVIYINDDKILFPVFVCCNNW